MCVCIHVCAMQYTSYLDIINILKVYLYFIDKLGFGNFFSRNHGRRIIHPVEVLDDADLSSQLLPGV